MTRTRKITYIGILVSLALILKLVENMLPLPYIAPGVKLGLTNIVSLIVLIYFDFKTALIVVVLRTFLAAFLSGRPYVILLGGTGAILSLVVMALLYYRFREYFSIPGISISGAVTHNIGQILVASLLIETGSIFAYLPVLLISGVVTGYFIGLIVNYLSKPLDSIILKNINR